MTNRTTTKITAALAALALTLSLSGCGSAEDEKAKAVAPRQDCLQRFEKYFEAIKFMYEKSEYEEERKFYVGMCVEYLKDPSSYKSFAADVEPSDDASAPGPIYDQSQVVEYLGLKGEDGSWTYKAPDGTTCDLTGILIDGESADLESPTQVVTTPEGNAGVVVTDEEQKTCMRLLTEALVDFEPAMAGE